MKYSARSVFIKILLILLLILCLLMPLGCGKKGPPVAPFSVSLETAVASEHCSLIAS
jgi:hypothetical protein